MQKVNIRDGEFNPDALRTLRLSQGSPIAWVARTLGVSRQTVYEAERGNVSLPLLRRMAALYGARVRVEIRPE